MVSKHLFLGGTKNGLMLDVKDTLTIEVVLSPKMGDGGELEYQEYVKFDLEDEIIFAIRGMTRNDIWVAMLLYRSHRHMVP